MQVQPHYDLMQRIIYLGKVAGGLAAIGGLLYGALRWAARMVKKVTTISTNVELLTTQHFPNMQQGFASIRTEIGDVKQSQQIMGEKLSNLGTQLDDGKKAINSLSDAFVRHLESASQEHPQRRKRNGVHAVAQL